MPNRSVELFEQAQHVIPGGVNSPVRSFRAIGGDPVYFADADGAYVHDVDGKSYIDYVGSWGPMIAGHKHPAVIEAVAAQIRCGLGYGAPTEIETRLAERVCELVPSVERVRMVNSGTEAAMSAIRLARGVTGRDRIVKFEGCYHGHADSLLVKAGSGALTLGVPTSPGVPAALASLTTTLSFNDTQQVRDAMREIGHEVAAVIVEPIAGNMNCIPPEAGFLAALRDACDDAGALLIFDEVMTGFRVHRNSAQGLYGVKPDITVLGKIIGGGLPVGAFGGPADIMAHIAPTGDVYQAGTLSGNPVAMASGLATLDAIADEDFYVSLETMTMRLVSGMADLAREHGVPMATNAVPGMFGLFFTDAERVTNFAQATACDVERFKRFFAGMLDAGVYLAPSPFEAGFVSGSHTADVIDRTLEAARTVLPTLA